MASRGVNKVILVGNLGQSPELKYMPNGDAVCNITVATSESWKDKATGQPVEKTEWHRVVMFRRLAEIAGEYLTKGSKVYIEGRLQTRKWEKKGVDHYTTEINASEMQMLDNKGDSSYATASHKPAQRPAKEQTAQPQANAPAADSFNDDIPF